MPKNKTVVEMHSCIECGRIFYILAIYTPDGRLVDCTVTSPGGHCVPDKRQPLVACDIHTAGEIEAAYNGSPGRSKSQTTNKKTDEVVLNGL